MYKMRIPRSFLIFMIVLLFAIIATIIIVSGKKVDYPALITSEEEFEWMVYDCASEYRNEINYQTTVDPNSMDFNKVFRDIMDRDTYVGCELFRYDYRYTYDGSGIISVNLRIQNPAWHRVVLTKLRVKQIASHLRDLSRYDQIKAVHDYLVYVNEYGATIGSAFNALYVNESACNGYAFSFYALMEELGIPATVEYGGNHAWNLVELDGEWYNIDVTWDDPGGKEISYTYFLKSNADFYGHEHYSATAPVSYNWQQEGNSEYFRRIPPYRLIMILSAVGAVIGIYVIYVIVRRRRSK